MDLGNSSLQWLKNIDTSGLRRVIVCKYQQKQYVCLKRVKIQNVETDLQRIMDEIYIMSQVSHPNIIKFIDSYIHVGTVNIIMEFAPNGTLSDLIKESLPKGFSSNNLLRYFSDILMGLEYLHTRGIMHLDLKPANLLVSENYCIKIADFGVSRIHTSYILNGSIIFGTPYYIAPEVMRGGRSELKSDIWSLGCTLYEMCCGTSPFAEANDINELRRLIYNQARPKFNCNLIGQKYNVMWIELCESMLTFNLKDRVLIPDIIRKNAKLTIPYYHKYFEYSY